MTTTFSSKIGSMRLVPLLLASLFHLAGVTPATGDAVDQAVCLNAKAVARQVASSEPLLKGMVTAGTLGVVAMRYDLDDGVAKVLP